MTNDQVSVVIPTYNRANCIRNAVDSVLAQTHSNWEILVVDDGSTDETKRLIAQEYGHDPRIRYIYQQNAGVSHARNTGMDRSRGDYIAFLDSDDRWKTWKLEVQLMCLRRFPEVGMVWTDMEAVNPEGAVIDPRHLKTMYSAYRFFQMDTLFEKSVPVGEITQAVEARGARFYAGDIYPDMIMGSLVHTSTVLLRRERMEKVKGFDESLKLSGEDYDFHLRTCKWGGRSVSSISLRSNTRKGAPIIFPTIQVPPPITSLRRCNAQSRRTPQHGDSVPRECGACCPRRTAGWLRNALRGRRVARS